MTLGALSRKAAVEITSGSRLLEGLDPTGHIVIHHTRDNTEDRSEEKYVQFYRYIFLLPVYHSCDFSVQKD